MEDEDLDDMRPADYMPGPVGATVDEAPLGYLMSCVEERFRLVNTFVGIAIHFDFSWIDYLRGRVYNFDPPKASSSTRISRGELQRTGHELRTGLTIELPFPLFSLF